MSVFVDPCRWPRGNRLICNVWADSVGELHQAAQAVDIPYAAFKQAPRSSWFHYEANEAERALLVARGAIETDIYGPSEFNARKVGDQRHLRAVAELRAQKNTKNPDFEGAENG